MVGRRMRLVRMAAAHLVCSAGRDAQNDGWGSGECSVRGVYAHNALLCAPPPHPPGASTAPKRGEHDAAFWSCNEHDAREIPATREIPTKP